MFIDSFSFYANRGIDWIPVPLEDIQTFNQRPNAQNEKALTERMYKP